MKSEMVSLRAMTLLLMNGHDVLLEICAWAIAA